MLPLSKQIAQVGLVAQCRRMDQYRERMERGHPVRLSAAARTTDRVDYSAEQERAAHAGGQDVRAPSAAAIDLITKRHPQQWVTPECEDK
jgi:hypothetical protein